MKIDFAVAVPVAATTYTRNNVSRHTFGLISQQEEKVKFTIKPRHVGFNLLIVPFATYFKAAAHTHMHM